MNRRTVCPLVASVLLTLTLSACSSLSKNPAGRLAYPGASLTNSVQSFGDSDNVTRTYSFVSPGPTVAQVFAWYAKSLSCYGYAASEPAPTVSGPRAVAQLFEGDGHRVDVTVEVAGNVPPDQAEATPSSFTPASPRTLRSGVSSMTVTIE